MWQLHLTKAETSSVSIREPLYALRHPIYNSDLNLACNLLSRSRDTLEERPFNLLIPSWIYRRRYQAQCKGFLSVTTEASSVY